MFKQKRIRDDGHVSKEDIEDESCTVQTTPGQFSRATPTTLASRRTLTAQRPGRTEEFARHIKVLNSSFHEWFNGEVRKNPTADLSDGVQDYVDFVAQLEDRYLRSFGEVLTFGSGDCGQLAHGTDEDNDLIVKFPRVVFSLRNKKVCGIACGGLHNAVFTETGQVYTWGCSDDGSLGRPGEESTPLLVESLRSEVIIGVGCGDGQTFAFSSRGEVWGWGCYKDKEGGKWFDPDTSEGGVAWKNLQRQQDLPLKIAGLSNIEDISCGASFNLATSSEGFVYSWGLGECGEMGRDVASLKKSDIMDKSLFLQKVLKLNLTPGRMFQQNTDGKPIGEVSAVKAIGCGAYHSLVLLVGGKVLGCGLNNYSQIGVDNESCTYLREIPELTDRQVVAVKGGVHHSLVLCRDGNMYAFGRGDSGQLGVSAENIQNVGGCSAKPVQPTMPADFKNSKIVQISCGGNHNLALADNNTVYTWGYGDMSALGHGRDQDEPTPKKINFVKAKIANITVTQVAGGGQHSAIIGQVLST